MKRSTCHVVGSIADNHTHSPRGLGQARQDEHHTSTDLGDSGNHNLEGQVEDLRSTSRGDQVDHRRARGTPEKCWVPTGGLKKRVGNYKSF